MAVAISEISGPNRPDLWVVPKKRPDLQIVPPQEPQQESNRPTTQNPWPDYTQLASGAVEQSRIRGAYMGISYPGVNPIPTDVFQRTAYQAHREQLAREKEYQKWHPSLRTNESIRELANR